MSGPKRLMLWRGHGVVSIDLTPNHVAYRYIFFTFDHKIISLQLSLADF